MRLPAGLVVVTLVAGLAGLAAPAAAQRVPSERRESSGSAPTEERQPLKDSLLFLGGFSSGLFLHESAHLVAGAALGARPRIDRLSIPLPFIVVHYDHVSRQREFVIASAGFWTQHLVSEWLLTTEPQLHRRAAPFRKGLFAFGVGTSALYTMAALTSIGTPERDTKSLAAALGPNGVPESVAGALILAPAALDVYRYYRPDARWPRWTSRALKVVSVALVFAAGR